MKYPQKLKHYLSKNKTGKLSDFNTLEAIAKPLEDVNGLRVPAHGKMTLLVLGIRESIHLSQSSVVTLGRANRNKAQVLDLSKYGAVERGVSRVHCQVRQKDKRVVVRDMDSTNGTYINGRRLVPKRAYELKKGDQLTLGRLPIQIMPGR